MVKTDPLPLPSNFLFPYDHSLIYARFSDESDHRSLPFPEKNQDEFNNLDAAPSEEHQPTTGTEFMLANEIRNSGQILATPDYPPESDKLPERLDEVPEREPAYEGD
ncbi:MAG: hypothetical protein ACJ746_00940 [Bryobacteraceae bacterium]